MVKEVRNSPKRTFKKIVFSPFTFPMLFLSFAIVTLPIIYISAQSEQDIRQQAASILTRSIAINTDDISYQRASGEIITDHTFTLVIFLTILLFIAICSLMVLYYRHKLSNY